MTSMPKTSCTTCGLSAAAAAIQGIARLVEGKDIDDIQALLCGIRCRNGTSCPDQLSKAIAEYKTERENAAAEK